MLPEQQQRILGYFIEEAKDHLTTIEQGLLNLQDTLKDSEMVNEVFRAAHSVKGGAAMLGLNSIQRTAHRLEDFFKVLRESPQIPVDQNLESLFLRVFDNLRALIEHLENASLTEDVASGLMSEIEPVFATLEQHLEALAHQSGGEPPAVAADFSSLQHQVMPQLRLMLQLFQQPQTDQTRQQLQSCCEQLLQLGTQFNLPGWCKLCETVAGAIAAPENTYQALAPVVIKELKQALGLAIAGREQEIVTSEQLQVLAANNSLADAEAEIDISTGDSLLDENSDQVLLSDSQPSAFSDWAITADPETEESALDSLFGEDSDSADSLFDREVAEFNELFAAAEATTDLEQPEVSDATEANSAADFSSLWSEQSGETDVELEIEEFSLALDIDSPNTQAEAAGEEFFQAFDDPWDEQPEMDWSSELENWSASPVPEPTADPVNEFDWNQDTTANFFSDSTVDSDPNLDFFFGEPAGESAADLTAAFEFSAETELESLGSGDTDERDPVAADAVEVEASADFAELEAMLAAETVEAIAPPSPPTTTSHNFVSQQPLDLSPTIPPNNAATVDPPSTSPAPATQLPVAASPKRRPAFEQMMRVPVKQLDNISNLVGELVVYRNSLEQDQEKLRQFLDNLLNQVQKLSDVGGRMQELYERSLLEASLLSNRQGFRTELEESTAQVSQHHATGMDFDALEMDRFTNFHTLSQEIIELIVRVRESSSDIEFVTDETEQVARQFRQVTTQLQEGLTRSRMVPFGQIAERLPRAVRDISLKCGKQAELQIEGQETLIDKGILEQLYDPMTHLVNNAITHGIESPEVRVAKGKPPGGQIVMRAFHQGNQTVIAVSDDGAGIDPEKVKAKAVGKGLITAETAATISRLDVYNLLFHAGFSTKDQVDEFAGRGVGMDVVLTSLNQMRGTITTDSKLDHGTTFTIRLPLTLSICKALCCLSDKARIAFPMDGVEQMLDISAEEITTNAAGQSCITWRDSLLPFRHLRELSTYNRQLSRGGVYGSSREDDSISIVILRSADTFIALQVDQVLGEQEIVIKQFEAPVPKPVGIAGATVLGDGRIMPIADVLELIDLSTGRLQQADPQGQSVTIMSPPSEARLRMEPMVLIVDDSITVRELLSMTFTNAGYRVEQARDGQEAWDKLRDGLPCQLVFCDIEMPRMDGLELLSRMQKEPRLSDLPIAMLTSRGSDRHRQMAVQLGASGYFTKPYLEEALLDAAQRMLRGEVLVTSSSQA